MAEQKTKPTEQSVERFLENNATDSGVQKDCLILIGLMTKITGMAPKMWGTTIIGFGQYHYKYASGHEGDICIAGFSPRKQNLSLYVLAGFPGQDELLKKLGKHKAGVGCLYIKKLEDVDLAVLELLIIKSVAYLKNKFNRK
jgi:hypothetical protein